MRGELRPRSTRSSGAGCSSVVRVWRRSPNDGLQLLSRVALKEARSRLSGLRSNRSTVGALACGERHKITRGALTYLRPRFPVPQAQGGKAYVRRCRSPSPAPLIYSTRTTRKANGVCRSEPHRVADLVALPNHGVVRRDQVRYGDFPVTHRFFRRHMSIRA